MICTKSELDSCIEKCMAADVVAVDTEFVWERTYYPILGLIQIATETESFLIDPLAFDDLSPLGALMGSEKTVKLLHDAIQDLQIIERATGTLPKNVFDTRAAAGFANNPGTLSLAALLELLVGVKLAKTESRTNWVQRPLSDKQIEYAIDDVIYMPEAYHKLVKMMKENETFEWFQEEMKSLEAPSNYTDVNSADRQFKKASGSSRFSSKHLAILKELIKWREDLAKIKDKPRNFIVDTNLLVDITMKAPVNASQLEKIKAVPHFCIKYHAEAITDAVKRGLESAPEDRPQPFNAAMDRKTLRKKSDRVLNFVKEKAETLKIDHQTVTSRKEVEAYINRFYSKKSEPIASRLTSGWRVGFLKELGPLVEEK